jgi:hypothetical protein
MALLGQRRKGAEAEGADFLTLLRRKWLKHLAEGVRDPLAPSTQTPTQPVGRDPRSPDAAQGGTELEPQDDD